MYVYTEWSMNQSLVLWKYDMSSENDEAIAGHLPAGEHFDYFIFFIFFSPFSFFYLICFFSPLYFYPSQSRGYEGCVKTQAPWTRRRRVRREIRRVPPRVSCPALYGLLDGYDYTRVFHLSPSLNPTMQARKRSARRYASSHIWRSRESEFVKM